MSEETGVREASEELHDEPTDRLAVEVEKSGVGPAGLAAMGSVLLSLYYYYVRGDEQRGQFVGLWPATILAFAAYAKLSRLERKRDD